MSESEQLEAIVNLIVSYEGMIDKLLNTFVYKGGISVSSPVRYDKNKIIMRDLVHALRSQIALLEAKRVPVKPEMEITNGRKIYWCDCGEDVESEWWYCSHCGQPLDWSET